MSTNIEKHRQILVAGYRAVGKTSVCTQFTEQSFQDKYYPTIENTYQKNIHYNGNKYVTNIIDSSGQDHFTILQPSFGLGMDAFILVYSITNRKSFEVLPTIYEKIINTIGTDTVPFIIVGNKCELDKQRAVSEAEGKKLAQKMDAVFLEVSAKRNYQIQSIFSEAFSQIDIQNPGKKLNSCIIC
eukprot:gene135-4381_t